MSIVHVTDESFENEVLRSDVPVLVDFWAAWCGPCRAIAPVLAQIAEEYEGKLKIAKLNVDENLGSTSAYEIRSIPTMILFTGGNPETRITGALPKSHITVMIERSASWKLTA